MRGRRLLNLATLPFRARPPVGTTPYDVVHRENKWQLLRYRPREGGAAFATPVLLVPSLINRHYILDLLPGRSFVEHLVAQGHDVLCIDWGRPGPEDRYLSFEDVVDRYLGRAVRVACRLGGRDRAHLLGYCMGGTLAVVHAALRPERVASLTALAAPVAFDDDGLLARWTRTEGFDVGALVDATGNVPWPLMQAAFHLLRPTLDLAKGVHLVDRAWNDRFLDGFLALETWANDNVSLPGAFYRTWIEDLYRGNALVRGALVVGGRPARLEAVTCPTQVVSFEQDGIVPPGSATPLLDLVGAADKTHLALPGSHVGGVTSSAAAASLWPALSAWWAERDGPRRAAA